MVRDIKDQSIFPQDDKHLLILTNVSLDYALMYLLLKRKLMLVTLVTKRVNLYENITAVARVHFEYDPRGKMDMAFIYSQDADNNLS